MRFIRRIWRTIQHWHQVDGNLLAAAVSFYAALAAFPMLMLLLAGFGFFMKFTGSGQDVQTDLIEFVSSQTSDKLGEQIAGLLKQIETSALVSAPLSLFLLLMLSMALFVNFERAFDRIWRSERPPESILRSIAWIVFYRLRAFLMLIVVAVLIVLNFASNFTIDILAEAVGEFQFSNRSWKIAQTLAATLLNAILFTMIYQTLPRIKVMWKHAIQGGVLAAISWEVGRIVLAMFVITDKYNAFGVVGVFMCLLLWTFYGVTVIFLGGVFVRVAKEEGEDGPGEESYRKPDKSRGDANPD